MRTIGGVSDANVDARDYSGRTYRHYMDNRLGTRLTTTRQLHALAATDRLSSRLCKTAQLAFGDPYYNSCMYTRGNDGDVASRSRSASQLLPTRSKKPSVGRNQHRERRHGSIVSLTDHPAGSLTPTGPANMIPPIPRRLGAEFVRRTDSQRSVQSVQSYRSEHEGTLV